MVASACLYLGFVKREQCDLVHAHMPISGLIGRDFGMEDDEVTVQVRAACLAYSCDGLMEVRNRAEVEVVQKAVAGRVKRSGSER